MGENDFVVVHVTRQNAGVFIRRTHDPVFGPAVLFEAFEASARNDDVLAAQNALRWEFPGMAVVVPLSTFLDHGFIPNLASFLDHASREISIDFASFTFKADTTIFEYREPSDPSLVTSMLMAILQENGRRVSPTLLTKMVRDDVCWNKADRPWRRLPFWLVLRVSVARYLAHSLGSERGRVEYKFLIALVLAKLLSEPAQTIERPDFLKAKLCRRLVKLEVDRRQLQDATVADRISCLFERLNRPLNKPIQSAKKFINSAWDNKKARAIKRIPAFDQFASEDDMTLDLPCSAEVLHNILTGVTRPVKRQGDQNNSGSSVEEVAKVYLNSFSTAHFKMIKLEAKCARFCETDSRSLEDTCLDACDLIAGYLTKSIELYQENAELRSIAILTVMELWVKLDQAACDIHPLLREYHPLFRPEIMDVLLLPEFHDMERVQRIQIYLRRRLECCTSSAPTIFDDPGKECFGYRFYEESENAMRLQNALEIIEECAARARENKKKEWQEKSRQYDEISKQIEMSTCVYIQDEGNPLGRGHHDNRCPRCAIVKRQSTLRIQAYEHPLPCDSAIAKTVVFELNCPATFARYRQTTWQVICRLGLSKLEPSHKPKCFIWEYSQLESFHESSQDRRLDPYLTLASTTKSFLSTHYSSMPFPVEWEGDRDSVCRPNGLRLAYYDTKSQVWTGQRRFRPTFNHHTKLAIPRSSPFSKLLQDEAFSDFTYGPSSYDVMATASDCPRGLNVHEYLAFQTVASGKSRRWLSILRELGSANLNFSSEATVTLLSHITMQCGPEGELNDVFRMSHTPFRELGFCEAMVAQLNLRLDSLSANWRETCLMDMIIVITLRMFNFAIAAHLEKVKVMAEALLLRARDICLRWFTLLRQEAMKSSETESAHRCQQYALWAALLCRQTFVFHLYQQLDLDDLSLGTFIQSSITVQDNLTITLDSLPTSLHRAVIRDIRSSYRLRNQISQSILTRPEAFSSSLKEVWPESDGNSRVFKNLNLEHHSWITCTTEGSAETESQRVLYNVVAGLLLVDDQPVGKLPADKKQLLILGELFGNQTLLTRPSDRNGMRYLLCVRPFGFQVHVGYDQQGQMLIRASRRKLTLQLIPRECFMGKGPFDLPGPLIMGRFHWLDLNSSDVYITNANRPWPDDKHRGWTLNFTRRICTRQSYRKGQHVVDFVVSPQSPLFGQAIQVMESLEDNRHVLVLQPGGGKRGVQIELPRLQLMFYVNRRFLLQSPELQSEIDPNQDAGTLYGLRSKIVCRSINDPNQRSILIPLGEIHSQSDGYHVSTSITTIGIYGKFQINTILGQLDCAPEPLLMYMKALVHCYTSSIIPDPLTGKSGIEEAIHWLKSGCCQPWAPLTPPSVAKLAAIAALTPRRDYYPPDRKSMRTDFWQDPGTLPISLQDSRLRPLVDSILYSSLKLEAFEPKKTEPSINEFIALNFTSIGDAHLHTRLVHRQTSLQRYLDEETGNKAEATPYKPRDMVFAANIPYGNVLEITHLLRGQPARMKTTSCLVRTLATAATIGGYVEMFDKVSLIERLKTDLHESWGALVRRAREGKCRYSLMFLFGPMAFHLTANMELVRVLVAFSVFEELRDITLPIWERFDHFRPDPSPQLAYLVSLLKPFQTPMPKDERAVLESYASAKQRRKIQMDRGKHEEVVDKDTRHVANFLLKQWPCLSPSFDGLEQSVLIDLGPALEVIRPEWKRLFQNLDLTRHLEAVQNVLNCRSTDALYKPPDHVPLGETYSTRLRGFEVPSLSILLLKPVKPYPIKSAETPVDCNAKTLGTLVPYSGNSFRRDGRDFDKPFRPRIISQTNDLGTQNNGIDGRLVQSVDRRNAGSVSDLEGIIWRLSQSRSTVKKRYAMDLGQSLQSFKELVPTLPLQANIANATLQGAACIETEAARVQYLFDQLQNAFSTSASDISERQIKFLKDGNLWPVITKKTVLAALRSISPQKDFGNGTREHMIELGVAITKLQRQIRLRQCAVADASGRYFEELLNEGHQNWNPSERPDWLLLEIESNLMIRAVQVDVALATISPASGANSVLQMNMGQGKTSCIIPMAAAALADRKQLVRVIVPKALLQQTAQLLQTRLGGILGRQLRHVPFSRRTPTTDESMRTFHSIYRDMQKSAGVMLCQPEHNLSFMLSGIQRILDNEVPQAKPMIKIQAWLTQVSRDILDESDYSLAVRTQLIYPSGSQAAVDGHPHRWQVAEALLELVNLHTYDLAHCFPQSIEVVRRHGASSFPLIFILRNDVEEELVRRVTSDVCQGLGGILPLTTGTLNSVDRVAIKDFISSTRPRTSSIELIRKLCPDHPSVRQTVYLLRGLLVNRILMMTLKKRWNVQYGLHPKRDPIAVPFHAKGVPSEQSEWGHPDVAILFTCLAFYHSGLNLEQLKQCIEHILKSDDPSTEYEKWTQTTENFPASLKAWNSINVDDETQLSEVWQAVRYSMVVVDYFLNNFVFPRHAKQFKIKLQSNGWDIPLFPIQTSSETLPPHLQHNDDKARPRYKPLTTGFSGTNDNRRMLPLTIKQEDLSTLSHTSAEVLTYLLQDRNRRCVFPQNRHQTGEKGRATEIDLLHELKSYRIRVLIDAGAQILEMNNYKLVDEWLKIDTSALAALYFDEGNKPWILSKTGQRTPLLASPFADDLSQCLVYLDEAHTRGTDLKLPTRACGALTLGLGQTKDHTVQAAMRLRQLGTTQSIKFFVPSEVHQSIADLQGKTMYDEIGSSDVVEWLLDNTCEAIEQLQPLYYSQGMDFCRRAQAALDHDGIWNSKSEREAYVSEMKQDEQQTLQSLYEPKAKSQRATTKAPSHRSLREFATELNTRRKTFEDTGKAVHSSALQEVEQEREVAFEVESVRQVKKPFRYPTHRFPGLHPHLESFAKTGRLPADASFFTHIFHSLSRTALGRKFKVSRQASDSRIYVSGEFDKTVKLSVDLSADSFLRPVNWILWSPAAETAVVVIPEEAELLIPMMRDGSMGSFLLTYAAPITRRMLQFNDLAYHSIPPLPEGWKAPDWLRIELGIYAGRLYYNWDEYKPLCEFLGVGSGSAQELDDLVGEAEEDVASADAYKADVEIPETDAKDKREFLVSKPLTFLQEWLAVRRRGQDFVHTPMGFLTQGKPLQEDHPFFRKAEEQIETDAKEMTFPVTENGGRECEELYSNDDVENDAENGQELDDGSEEHVNMIGDGLEDTGTNQ